MHRIGGLEKEDGTGNINYTPENHEQMVHLRAAKIAGIADDIPPLEIVGDDDAELCILGWGSTWAAIDAAVQRTPARRHARSPGSTSPTSTRCRRTSASVLRRFPKVLVPELNLGQLCRIDAGRVPGRRPVARQGAGPAVHRPRDRGRHREGARHR